VKHSIQAVLLGGTIAVLVAVLGGAAWVAYEAGQDEAEELFDARLATSARVLEALVVGMPSIPGFFRTINLIIERIAASQISIDHIAQS